VNLPTPHYEAKIEQSEQPTVFCPFEQLVCSQLLLPSNYGSDKSC
jgi:hypothetical protein